MFKQSSFGVQSSVMTNKNHSLVVCNKCVGHSQQSNSFNKTILQCYIPKNANGTVSLVKKMTTPRKMTNDQNLAIIPANAIIDKIEFFGINGFSTKDTFSIGLGQLNGHIMTCLVENTTAAIANEKVGGCREFISESLDGKNSKTLVLIPSNVNIVLENPVTSGSLLVIIEYHLKPTLNN